MPIASEGVDRTPAVKALLKGSQQLVIPVARDPKVRVAPPRVPLVLVLFTLAIVAFTFGPPWGMHAGYAILQKKHAYLHQAGSPKVVLIGGSNVAMNMDSERICQALNRPVVNMGLCGSIGLRYQLAEVRDEIGKGDLLVIMPEYEHFSNLNRQDTDVHLDGCADLLRVVQVFPASIQWIAPIYTRTPTNIVNFILDIQRLALAKGTFFKKLAMEALASGKLDGVVGAFKPKTLEDTGAIYNKHGDSVSHLTQSPPVFDELACDGLRFPYTFCTEAQNELADFAKFAHAKGAAVVMIPVTLPEVTFKRRSAIVNDMYGHLRTIPAITVLGTPSQYTLPHQYFYDCSYHLHAEGRQRRTTWVIEQLQAFCNTQK